MAFLIYLHPVSPTLYRVGGNFGKDRSRFGTFREDREMVFLCGNRKMQAGRHAECRQPTERNPCH